MPLPFGIRLPSTVARHGVRNLILFLDLTKEVKKYKFEERKRHQKAVEYFDLKYTKLFLSKSK